MAIATLTDWHRPKGIKRALAKRRFITVGGVSAWQKFVAPQAEPVGQVRFDLRDDHPDGTGKTLALQFTEEEATQLRDSLNIALAYLQK